jgi:hypothetical protein
MEVAAAPPRQNATGAGRKSAGRKSESRQEDRHWRFTARRLPNGCDDDYAPKHQPKEVAIETGQVGSGPAVDESSAKTSGERAVSQLCLWCAAPVDESSPKTRSRHRFQICLLPSVRRSVENIMGTTRRVPKRRSELTQRWERDSVILASVEEIRTRTLVLPDIRGEDRVLRITWHPASFTVVFSHWTGSVCTASTPVSLSEASRVIDLLVGALRDVVSSSRENEPNTRTEVTRTSRLLDRFRTPRASIVEVRRRIQEEWRRVAR